MNLNTSPLLMAVIKVLKNFPSIGLITKDIEVDGNSEKDVKHFLTTLPADFYLKAKIKNKQPLKKRFKMIFFITDV